MAVSPAAQSGFDQAQLYLWVKGLESKLNNLLREVDLLKNDFIRKNQDVRKEVKALGEDMWAMKHEQTKTLEKMDLVIKELKQTAGMEEVQTIKKYLDLWNPLHFVTQRDVERVVEQSLRAAHIPDEVVEQTDKKEKHLPFL